MLHFNASKRLFCWQHRELLRGAAQAGRRGRSILKHDMQTLVVTGSASPAAGHPTTTQGRGMNDISISSISDVIGLSALLTEQTLALPPTTTEFLAALFTVFIGIWAFRRASAVLRDWLTGSSRIDRTWRRSSRRRSLRHPDADHRRDARQFRRRDHVDHCGTWRGGSCCRTCPSGHPVHVAAGLMLFPQTLRGDWGAAGGLVRERDRLFTTIIDTFDNVYVSIPNSAIGTRISSTMRAMEHAASISTSA